MDGEIVAPELWILVQDFYLASAIQNTIARTDSLPDSYYVSLEYDLNFGVLA